MKSKDKIYLNKTLYQLRKLPDIDRERLVKFIYEKREYGPTYLTQEMFEYLTGSISPDLKSIYSFNISSFGQYVPRYPISAPYFKETKYKDQAEKFHKELLETAKVLCKMDEKDLKIYLKCLTKPNTKLEICKRKMTQVSYNTWQFVNIKVSHLLDMATHKDYRQVARCFKQSLKQKTKD